MENAFF